MLVCLFTKNRYTRSLETSNSAFGYIYNSTPFGLAAVGITVCKHTPLTSGSQMASIYHKDYTSFTNSSVQRPVSMINFARRLQSHDDFGTMSIVMSWICILDVIKRVQCTREWLATSVACISLKAARTFDLYTRETTQYAANSSFFVRKKEKCYRTCINSAMTKIPVHIVGKCRAWVSARCLLR